MNCRHVQHYLSDYHDGLLPPRDAAAVTAHLTACQACARLHAALQAFEARARATAEWQPAPRLDLGRRAIDRWLAETGARETSHQRGRRRLAFGAVSLALLAALGIGRARWEQAAGRDHSPRIARRTSAGLRSRKRERTEIAKLFLPRKRERGSRVLARSDSGGGRAPGENAKGTGRDSTGNRTKPERIPPALLASLWDHPDFAPSPPSRFRGKKSFSPSPSSRFRAKKTFVFSPSSRFHAQNAGPSLGRDDLASLNGDSLRQGRRWAQLPHDAWAKIEAQVRRNVHVNDDFVTIPFPRLAATDARLIAAAADGYKQEAAIVDPRLSHEVSCAFKATALADLCDQLRVETGIQLSAGPSVADEKVTVFCEKLPLREVMRQLSRPFGYTWLRTKREGGDYRYELVQDLRSQLLEEELRNRDRDAALIALDQEMQRYHPYLNLSPDEALARAKTAGEGDKKLLETLSQAGWGPIQMYFQLSPQDQAALRAGQELKFKQEPGTGERPLPPEIARGVLQSRRDLRMVRESSGKGDAGAGQGDVRVRQARAEEQDGLPPSAVPEARAAVTLKLEQTELGRFGFSGSAEVSVQHWTNGHDNGPYAVGQSPSTLQPENAAVNAALARDPALRGRVTVHPGVRGQGSGVREGVAPPRSDRAAGAPSLTPDPRPLTPDAKRLTTADALEALHRATGMPIIADFYTRLYKPETLSIKDQPLYEALNHLADAMRLRWNKEYGWLQFRSASFYNDRSKEVPNRLLSRWAAARREHGALRLDDLIEIASLSDAQLDARDMAEGAKEIWGLEEWGLAGDRALRPHLRWMAGFSPAEREKLQRAPGLRFTELTLPQQQQFIPLALGSSTDAVDSLDELSTAAVQIDEELPGQFEWKALEKPHSGPPEPLAPVRAPTREAALAAARRLDPQADPTQIQPTETAITLLYYWGTAQSNGVYHLHTTGPGDTSINRSRNKNSP